MNELSAVEAMEKISKEADKCSKQENRVLNNHTVGDVVRQGDLYIHAVVNDHPAGEVLKIDQIAEGTSLGARHILKGDFKVYEGKQNPEYIEKWYPVGYVFDVLSRAVITHPEHAHVEINCPGRFQVSHQMDMLTRKRVAD